MHRNTLGLVGYLTALALGLVSAAAALAMCALYYLTPGREDPAPVEP